MWKFRLYFGRLRLLVQCFRGLQDRPLRTSHHPAGHQSRAEADRCHPIHAQSRPALFASFAAVLSVQILFHKNSPINTPHTLRVTTLKCTPAAKFHSLLASVVSVFSGTWH